MVYHSIIRHNDLLHGLTLTVIFLQILYIEPINFTL